MATGADETTVTTNDTPLTLAEAVKAYTAPEPEEEADEGQSDADDEQDGENADESELDEGEDEDGEPDDDGQAGDDEADDEDPDGEDDTGEEGFAADDAKVKLADGTVVSIAQLKSGHLMDRDYRQKTMVIAEEKKALANQSTAFQQAEKRIAEQQDYMVRLLQSIAPKAPDPALLHTDPMAYLGQKEQHENFTQHLQYIQQQQTQADKDRGAKQQGERTGRVNDEWVALVEKAPELKDETKVKALAEDVRKFGTEYGFTPEELSELPLDHRQVLVLRKAIAWDKLQANKAKAKAQPKDEKRPPVQKGGKRLHPKAAKAREANQAMDRLNKSGSLRDGVAAFLAIQERG